MITLSPPTRVLRRSKHNSSAVLLEDGNGSPLEYLGGGRGEGGENS